MSEKQLPDEDNLIEQLALRLLVHPGGPQVNRPRLVPGQMPANLPLEVPIPEKSRVLGTLVRSDEHSEIVLTSDLQAAEILSFYRERLKSLGWNELEDINRHHMEGFLYNHLGPYSYITFCQGTSGASLILSIMPLEGATTDVRLTLNLDDESSPCSIQQKRMRRRMGQPGPSKVIPPLSSPVGTQQRGGNGSSGMDEANTTATLKTDLPIEVVFQHYTNQLNQAGWTLIDEGASGPLTWATWNFTDEDQEPWNGLFFVLKTPAQPENYFLYVRAAWNRPTRNSRLSI